MTDPFDDVITTPAPKAVRHVTTRQRLGKATDPTAATAERLHPALLPLYAGQGIEINDPEGFIAHFGDYPPATTTSPSTIVKILHLIMRMPDQVRVNSRRLHRELTTTSPFNNHIWTVKIIGDLLGQLAVADRLRRPEEGRSFVTGRDGRSRWFMVESHYRNPEWIKGMAEIASYMAEIRLTRQRRGRSTTLNTSKTTIQWISDLADQVLDDATTDWQTTVDETYTGRA